VTLLLNVWRAGNLVAVHADDRKEDMHLIPAFAVDATMSLLHIAEADRPRLVAAMREALDHDDRVTLRVDQVEVA
jgi:hypothetical protein